MSYITPTGATPSGGGTPGRVAGPVVSSSAGLLPSTTVSSGYKNLEITLHGIESFGTHFFQLYLNGDTTPGNYITSNVQRYGVTSSTFTSYSGQASYFLGFYAADPDARAIISIPDYSSTGTKSAFYQCAKNHGLLYLTGSIFYNQTDPITSIQISLRSTYNALGTAQNVTASYSLAYLL